MKKMTKVILLPLVAFTISSCRFQDFFKRHGDSSAPTIELNCLTTPKVEKESEEYYFDLSSNTANSYRSFATKFSSLCFNTMRSSGFEDSLGVSIPDAYLCFALEGIISNDAARADILSYLELNNVDELKESVKEILQCFCTLYKNEDNKYVGGYNLNSLWLNPDQVALVKEKDEQLYQDLEEIFDVSTYFEALTSEKANQYMKDNGLKDMPVPEIKLDDDNPPAVGVMSAYYCMDYYPAERKDLFKKQYKSGNHKMDYQVNNQTKKVDYIETTDLNMVLEGDNFVGTFANINNLQMGYFLPNDVNASAHSIFQDVVSYNYGPKNYVITSEYGNQYITNTFDVTVSAPYFLLDNEIELDYKTLASILPVITKGGAAERMVESKNGYPLLLSFLKQFSVMKYNYDGFYSCSVTIMGNKEGSALEPEYKKFELILNHPYVFEVTKTIRLDHSFLNTWPFPIVIGEIVNPDYTD